ncbi:MAG: hypothetical protein BWY57_01391 [Betaproteobacteria bacterium ADurb.Bin341]|nr:MAG: hypothetical protein BWY57_01391 [Betaproteobacteria bacterium ADurb.Bin341]
MKTFTYNDMDFTVEKVGKGWEIRKGSTVVASGLYAGLADAEAEAKSIALAKTIYPVGIRIIGPDVTHPVTVGDIKYYGPDVTHPNFIYWNKDSASQPKQL